MSKSIQEWTNDIHSNAVKHGWWEDTRSFGDHIALCHSELSEALEEERKYMPNEYFIDTQTNEVVTDMSKWNGEKTEGRATEMIDCVIRILDWCGANNIDVEAVMSRKHSYNKTRSYKHGNKKL